MEELQVCMLTGRPNVSPAPSVFIRPTQSDTQKSGVLKRASGNSNDKNAPRGRLISLGPQWKHEKSWGGGVYISELCWPLGCTDDLCAAGTVPCRQIASLPFVHNSQSTVPSCMHSNACDCPGRPEEEGHQIPLELELNTAVTYPSGCWELNSGPFIEQPESS